MGLNYMSKQIMYSTATTLSLFSITESKIIATRSITDILGLKDTSGKQDLY